MLGNNQPRTPLPHSPIRMGFQFDLSHYSPAFAAIQQQQDLRWNPLHVRATSLDNLSFTRHAEQSPKTNKGK